MRVLGIDYGTKRIGLALSDESESIAFPFRVVANDSFLFEIIRKIIETEDIGEAVIGVSTTQRGEDNKIEGKRKEFTDKLRQNIPVKEIDERFSSHEARLREFGNDQRSARKEKKVLKDTIDAEAAQIILQRYLDQKKNI